MRVGAACDGGGGIASPSSGGRECEPADAEGMAMLCMGEDADAEEGALPLAPLLRVLRERYSDTSEPS